MSWTPPRENDFNDHWIRPLDALDVSDIRMAEDADRWEIVEKLRAGQLVAVARTAQSRPDIAGTIPFVPVSPGAWRRMNQSDEFYFWRTGHLVVAAPPNDMWANAVDPKDRYFDIRFAPESFDGKPRPSSDGAIQQPLPIQARATPHLDKPAIATAECERFCRGIIAGWPEAGQDWAYEKALLFYPENKVARDRFRAILRSIRGATKPGKKPKTSI